MGLVVNLDEFSELCGTTGETMRKHIRELVETPAWMLKRGTKGSGYEIDSDLGIAWWKARREADDHASSERLAQLQQLRFEHLGDAADNEEALGLSGKQRREEYAAVVERIKLRRLMGELVERAPLEAQLTHAAVEHRRQLMLIPAEYAATEGIAPETVRSLAGMIERAVEKFIKELVLPGAGPGGGVLRHAQDERDA